MEYLEGRNNRIFNNLTCEAAELVEAIKVLSWRWKLSRLKVPASLFYEWYWCPRDCLILDGAVSVLQRLRLRYAVVAVCGSGVLLFGIC